MTPGDLIAFEKEVADTFNAGRIRAPIHLSGGNEEQLIRVFRDVGPDDWVCGSWRMHYQCLLKGVPRERLMADILAGKSITLCYPDFKIYSSAIVGGSLPIALGIAKAIKLRGGTERVHAFLGDMTDHSGIAWECQQYAAGHALPIRFIVEDNNLSVCTPTWEVWGDPRNLEEIMRYEYKLPWPHSGAGVRVQF